MKFIIPFLLLVSISLTAQQKIKVKREDNRFFFFQTGKKNDTIIKNKSDLFLVKFPDSLMHSLQITIENGQLIKTKNDSLYKLVPILGMKYSLSKPDSTYIALHEGICTPSKTINIKIKDLKTEKIILQNIFLIK